MNTFENYIYDNKSKILVQIEEALTLCQDYILPIEGQSFVVEINEEIIPSLYDARTYIELGYLEAPTINISITKAMFSASNLTDRDPKFAPLFSKLRIIKEITDSLSITFERGNKNID